INNIAADGPQGQLAVLANIRRELGERKELANHQDVDATLRGMASKLDPRSMYVDPQTLLESRRGSHAASARLGVIVRRDKESGHIVVRSTIKDSPAYLAGLKKDDVVLELHLAPSVAEERKVIILKSISDAEVERHMRGLAQTRVDM